MPYEHTAAMYPYVAGADLTAATNFGRAVVQAADGRVVLAGANVRRFGVLKEPANVNRGVTVQELGVTKARAGAAIAIGALVTTDANGRFITAAATNQVWGVAETAATALDDIFTLNLNAGNAVA